MYGFTKDEIPQSYVERRDWEDKTPNDYGPSQEPMTSQKYEALTDHAFDPKNLNEVAYAEEVEKLQEAELDLIP